MNGPAGIEENVMSTPDKIESVKTELPDTLVIELASGKVYRVSLADPIQRISGFAPLTNPAMFSTAKMNDFGWTVEWDCGLSMASERLYQMGKEQSGKAFPVAEFKAWMQRNGMSLTTASETLGLSRRAVSQYSSGARPIPKVVGLACRAIDLEHA
jgi:lambda repressor-like predicted transcriptional regulator